MSGAVLHLVVGPSGAGKDTLIDAARAERPDILYPARVVTRPADAGGEAHEALSPDAFARREAAGGFFLSWRAHGLAYGIPAEAGAALAAGRHVLVNVSRAAIGQARARWPDLRIVAVSAPLEVLAARLAHRGRETEIEVAARLRRVDMILPDGPEVVHIDNGGDLSAARAAFLAALAPVRAAARPARERSAR